MMIESDWVVIISRIGVDDSNLVNSSDNGRSGDRQTGLPSVFDQSPLGRFQVACPLFILSPHLQHQGAVVTDFCQSVENGGKVDLSFANDQITELPAATGRYLAGIFEVDLHDMVSTQLQLGAGVVVPAGDIADIRIGHEVGEGICFFSTSNLLRELR